jgi:organic hydroperoxide reductase OsmC/OhrA
MALELRAACERCNVALPEASADAWICTHECTFCTACTAALERTCPNCQGELVRRPRRGALGPVRRTLHARSTTAWTGNRGKGTSSYRAYGRDHSFTEGAKAPIAGSSDPSFLGDPARWSPEELLAASISACHMLWYLHLCSEGGVIVTDYTDDAEALLLAEGGGDGRMASTVLRPQVTIAAGSDAARAKELHHEAHARCFIANACAMPVTVEPTIVVS